MKHVRILGLLVMAAASLMAFASSASANPILTGPEAGKDYTGTITATLEPGTSALLKAGIEDTCTVSTVTGTVTTNNTTHAAGPISHLSFGSASTPCTQDTTVVTAGSLTLADDGTVYTEGSRVKVQVTSLGITCYYGAETGSVKIGKLTPGHPATIDIETTELQRLKESNTFFCASAGTWTGKYNVTFPSGLTLT